MLVPDGQTVFLGGLIRRNTQETREGVPVLGEMPGVGLLFSNRSRKMNATEIVVLITPKLIDFRDNDWNIAPVFTAEQIEQELDKAEHAAYADLRRLLDEHELKEGEEIQGAAPVKQPVSTSKAETRPEFGSETFPSDSFSEYQDLF